jgi:hypothetical protein
MREYTVKGSSFLLLVVSGLGTHLIWGLTFAGTNLTACPTGRAREIEIEIEREGERERERERERESEGQSARR